MKNIVNPRHSYSYLEYLEPRVAPATIVVTSLSDSGAGSLREAVTSANLTATPDTISFQSGLSGTIELASQIAITTPLTIKGPGATKITLSGEGTTGILNITDGTAATDSAVAISGLSFMEGSAANGGAIYDSESLTVTNCVFLGNVATGNGGAIWANGDQSTTQVKITGSQFSGNSAANGGALYLEVSGGISIVKSSITGNSASGSGGGAYLSQDYLDTGAKILISASVISGNTAGTNGGGLRINGDFNTTPVSLVKTNISNNTAGGIGGGLYFQRGDLSISGGTFSNNSADTGGAIYFDRLDVGTISKTTFANNRATDAAGEGGGAVALNYNTDADSLTFSGATFTGNSSAADGGAISLQTGGLLTVLKSKFFSNRAADAGGAISTNDTGSEATTVNVTGSLFSDNSAYSGGAIDSNGIGDVSISSSKFLTNQTTTEDGGALYLRSEGLISVVKSLFQENFSKDDGGAIAISPDGITAALLSGLTVLNNTALGEGGGILIQTGTATISKSSIRGNFTMESGGGIDNYSTLTLVKSTVSGNFARLSEGGIFSASAITNDSSKIIDNLAPLNPNSN